MLMNLFQISKVNFKYRTLLKANKDKTYYWGLKPKIENDFVN